MGFLLIDAQNTFNEADRTKILFIMQHLWHMVTCFTFNFYCHHKILYLKSGDCQEMVVMLGHEEVTQGRTLKIVTYRIYSLSLIRILEKQYIHIF